MPFVGGEGALLLMSVVEVKFPWRPGSRESGSPGFWKHLLRFDLFLVYLQLR